MLKLETIKFWSTFQWKKILSWCYYHWTIPIISIFKIIKCTYKYSRKKDTFGRPFRFTRRFNQQWIATGNTDPFGQVSADTKIHGAKSAKVGKGNSAIWTCLVMYKSITVPCCKLKITALHNLYGTRLLAIQCLPMQPSSLEFVNWLQNNHTSPSQTDRENRRKYLVFYSYYVLY